MNKTVKVIFDGQTLRPESPLDLQPNTEYLVTIEAELPRIAEGDAWDLLEEATGSVNAPTDWSSEHDHYLYGAPKYHVVMQEQGLQEAMTADDHFRQAGFRALMLEK